MSSTSTSIIPSYATLPEGKRFATVFEFIVLRFPRIPESVWRDRIMRNMVHFDDGELIDLSTPYQSRRRICYYREVEDEAKIPFDEEILFENKDLVVVDKPHFLPVHPAGKFVNETLITRLRTKYGWDCLCSAHRIDRMTAGLVLCIKNPDRRGLYQQLFQETAVKKTYLAAAKVAESIDQTHWHLQTRIESHDDHFRMRIVPGEPNSESFLDLIDRRDGLGLFRLRPVTGKKHQLRLHLCSIGCGILNDPLYPNASEEEPVDDYDRPMQLLAQRLEFIDPVSGKKLSFSSRRSLSSFPDFV